MPLQHVTVLGFRKVLGTSITIPMEMLNAADLIHRIHGKDDQRLNMQVASPEGGKLTLTAGLELANTQALNTINETDLIIVPALWGNPKGVIQQHPNIQTFLIEQSAQNTPICAVGTGSFFLAEAGLLQNRVATTHWYYFEQFAELYPHVHLQRDRFTTRASNLYCAGSVNSVRDIMLFFIEEFYDANIAHQISRHFTHEIKRSYVSNTLKHSPQELHDDEAIINIQEWLLSRHHDDISLQQLAAQFDMSIRTLNRHFRQATGQSPMQYLQQIRIDSAKSLLKSTNLSISEIAFSVGYSDSSYFSSLFRKAISLSPREYRRLVRKKLFRVDS